MLAISTFFWLWALKNTMEMSSGVDLGIVSFLSVMISSTYLLCRNPEKPLSKFGIYGILSTYILVSANYALGFWFGLHIDDTILYGFSAYCFIFTFLWLGCVKIGWNLLQGFQIHVEEKENLYDFERGRDRNDPGSFSYY